MKRVREKRRPGEVRDAIVRVLVTSGKALPVKEIERGVSRVLGSAPPSSVRSYLRLNTPEMFVRESRGVYRIRLQHLPGLKTKLDTVQDLKKPFCCGGAKLFHADCFDWFELQPDESLHAIVTDPPYGLHEYTPEQQTKLRNGKGGVWRIPPSFDGNARSPLPRFTTLTQRQLDDLGHFFFSWARVLLPRLVPGGNVVVASNPLLSYIVAGALAEAGLERAWSGGGRSSDWS